MPRQPKPWFRKGRGWYVQINGQQVPLGTDKAAAHREFHRLMATETTAKVRRKSDTLAVNAVLDGYLDWLANRVKEGVKAPRTYEWYQTYLQSFATFKSDTCHIAGMAAEDLQPYHVYQWADAQTGWKAKRGPITAVARAFNWAARAGMIPRSPLTGIEKPAQGRRELLVSEAEYREVLAVVADQQFRDLLELSWETGCRPHEIFTVEAAFVDLDTARWVFPIRLSKGKKIQRVVYLSDRAAEITRRLMAEQPTGPLLRNTDGVPWRKDSVHNRFQRIAATIGRRKLSDDQLPPRQPKLTGKARKDVAKRAEHEALLLARRKVIARQARAVGIRLNLYAFRHSMITESLVNGIDAVTVSVLAGHQSIAMIAKHYAHLDKKHDHMRDAANRVRGQPDASTSA